MNTAWIKERLKEPSTIRGLVIIISVLSGALGVSVSPEDAELIAGAVMAISGAVIGLIEVFRKEKADAS